MAQGGPTKFLYPKKPSLDGPPSGSSPPSDLPIVPDCSRAPFDRTAGGVPKKGSILGAQNRPRVGSGGFAWSPAPRYPRPGQPRRLGERPRIRWYSDTFQKRADLMERRFDTGTCQDRLPLVHRWAEVAGGAVAPGELDPAGQNHDLKITVSTATPVGRTRPAAGRTPTSPFAYVRQLGLRGRTSGSRPRRLPDGHSLRVA